MIMTALFTASYFALYLYLAGVIVFGASVLVFVQLGGRPLRFWEGVNAFITVFGWPIVLPIKVLLVLLFKR
jgi:hypothetical protein